MASFSLTLVVHPSVPVSSVAEFVAYAKARNDRPLIYGSGGGPGSPGHLAMEYLRTRVGFAGVHVPHKGNAEVVKSSRWRARPSRVPRHSRRLAECP